MKKLIKRFLAVAMAAVGLSAFAADTVTGALQERFPSPSVVEPQLDATGKTIGHTVILGMNMTDLELTAYLGPITIDLNGYSIRGTDGTDGSTEVVGQDGKNGVKVTTEGTDFGIGATLLSVRNSTTSLDTDTGTEFQPGVYVTVDLVGDDPVVEEQVNDFATFEAKYTNEAYKTTKMVFRRVPAGGYEMQKGAEFSGIVNLTKDYCIAVFELTQAQYTNLMAGTSYKLPQVGESGMLPVGKLASGTDCDPIIAQLNAKLGTGYRASLPTEAQWERAARAGSTNVAFGAASEYAVCNGDRTAEVGSKKANAWGLYDVYGNVREYCLDQWNAADKLPFGTDPALSNKLAETWVTRGSSYTSPEADCTSNYRAPYGLNEPAYGVRLVLNTTTARPASGNEAEPGIYGGNGGSGMAPQKFGKEAIDPNTAINTTDPEHDPSLLHKGADGYVLLAVPTANTGLTYNGEEQTGVTPAAGYTLTGNTGTAARDYTATAHLDATNKWFISTGVFSTDDQAIAWSIACKGATVEALNETIKFGETPVLAVVTNGVLEADTLNFEVKCDTDGTVGRYPINFVVDGAEIVAETTVTQGNYSVKFTPATLTIDEAPVDPSVLEAMLGTWTNVTYTYDGQYHGASITNPLPTGVKSVTYDPTNEFVNASVTEVTAKIEVEEGYVAIADTNVTVTILAYAPGPDGFEIKVEPLTNDYTGVVQAPAITVTDKAHGFVLVEGRDYEKTVTYESAPVTTNDVKNVGEYTYTFTGKGNYASNEGQVGTAKYVITKKTITVKPDADQSKVFGDADPTFTYTWTAEGNPSIEIEGALGREEGEGADEYAFTTGTLAVHGDAAGYRFVIEDDAAKFTITQRPLTTEMIKIAPATNNYTGAENLPTTLEVEYESTNVDTNLVEAFDIATKVWDKTPVEMPGTYQYIVTATDDGNFCGAATNTYVIKAIPLTITAVDTNLCYGTEEKTAVIAYTAEGLLSGHTVTGVMTRVNADNHNVGTNKILQGTVGVEDVAHNDVTAGYAIDWQLGNYIITQKVLKAEMFTLQPTNEVVYTGLPHGPTGVTAKDDDGPISVSDYTYTLPRWTDIGTYQWEIKGKGNYSGTVKKPYKILPIPFDPSKVTLEVADNLVYNGNDQMPAVTIKAVQFGVTTNLKENVDYTINWGAEGSHKTAGEYSATATFIDSAYFTGSTNFTYQIHEKTLWVTPTNITVTYGQELPEKGGVTYTGLVEGDSQDAIVAATELDLDFGGFTGDRVCETNFVATGAEFKAGLTSTNYVFAYSNATLKVLPRDISLATATSASQVYDGQVKTPVLDVSDKPGETELITPSDWTVTWNPEEIKNAGTYTATLHGTNNYTGVLVVDNCFTVTPLTVQLEWNPTNFYYTGAPQKPTATVTNAVEGDEVLVTVTGEETDPGTYTATADALTGAAAANYQLGEPKPTVKFTIAKSDKQEALEDIFGDAAKIEPVRDAAGNVTNWLVSLTNNMEGVVEVPDNLGNFTLDVNDHTITGTNGVNGTTTEPGVDGGAAIEFVKGDATDEDYGPTQIAVVGDEGDGGFVAGGNGGNGNPGGKGAEAFTSAADADPEAGYTQDTEDRVRKGEDGTSVLEETITLVNLRSRYPWQAAVDATYQVVVNTEFFDYAVQVTVSNNMTGATYDFTTALDLADGTNTVILPCTDLVSEGFAADYFGNVTVYAELDKKAKEGGLSLLAVAGYEYVTNAASGTVYIDCRATKEIRLSENKDFNVSSNEWDKTPGDALTVTYKIDNAGNYSLEPVENRVMKNWEPTQAGTYEFTQMPGGDEAKFNVLYPENVTNSFPVEKFNVSWDPEADSWVVTPKADLNETVKIADDIGKVTLDLAGNTIVATNGVTGAGGNAIEIVNMANPDGGLNTPTILTIKDTDYQNHAGEPAIRGGDGASAVGEAAGNGFDGGAGIAKGEGVSDGVAIYVDNDAWIRGGNGGDSSTAVGGNPGPGIVDDLDWIERGDTAKVENGTRGTGLVNHWAWCYVDNSVETPHSDDGVTKIGEKLYFFKRNEDGAAEFNFQLLEDRNWEPTDKKIYFVGGTIPVASLIVSNTYEELTFISDPADSDTILKATGDESTFVVTAGDNQMRRFEKLQFEGSETDGAYDGGAIRMVGGALEVADCDFVGCHTAEAGVLGGAICAGVLADESIITNCTFTDCEAGKYNGAGGAIHATAKTAGIPLNIVDSTFDSNYAANGGAIHTMPVYSDASAEPIDLVLKHDTFVNNSSFYNGGAILASGNVKINEDADEDNVTLFEGNSTKNYGGAINMNAVDEDCIANLTIGSNTVFNCNMVSNSYWVGGGAIAMMMPGDGNELDIMRATFSNNVAVCNDADPAWSEADGGAIYIDGGVTETTITKTGFYDNSAASKTLTYGGALVSFVGNTMIENCVFDRNAVEVEDGECFAAALDFEGDYATVKGTIQNSTFRNQNIEAIGGYQSTVDITNCVAVGNGIDIDIVGGLDILFEDCTVTMDHSAYGNYVNYKNGAEAALNGDTFNLANRTDEIYDGELLELNPNGFNPVAALGLVQNATDFKDVVYGSYPSGFSMGAFETPTEMLVINVYGNRRYDGTPARADTTNWVWSLTLTNGTAVTNEDFGDVSNAFDIVTWTYGDKNVGFYSSQFETPSNLVCTLKAKNDFVQLLVDYGAITNIATGDILKRPVQFKSGSDEKVYDTLPLTNGEVWDCSEETLANDTPCGMIAADWAFVTTNVTGTITDVGVESNWFTVGWNNEAVKNNYDIKDNIYGELVITPRPASDLDVGPTDYEITYGGTNATPPVTVAITNELGVVISNLVINLDFEVAYTNNVNAFDKPYYVVTPSSNFTGTVTNYFKINPRDVEFWSASAHKKFDNKPLTTNEVWYTKPTADAPDAGILEPEAGSLKFDVTGSQTQKGSSSNYFTVVWNEPGIVSSNYNVIAYHYGILTVDKMDEHDGLVIKIYPEEYEWTGDNVKPTHIEVWDMTLGDNGELVPESEYDVFPENNRDVTDSAMVTVKIKPDSSYNGQAQTNYWITAYYVEYFKDGEQIGPTEKIGALSGSNVFATVRVPKGYCLDWQNSKTNDVVTRFNSADPKNYGQLTLQVFYEVDSNDDDIPDRFQKAVRFKVVNGYWNDDTTQVGYDVLVWKTLMAEDGITWSEEGTAALDTTDVPGVGERPMSGYAKNIGEWTPALGTKVSKEMFPYYLYAYGRTAAGTDGHGGRGRSSAEADATGTKLFATLRIVSFARSIEDVTLGATAAVVDNEGNTFAEESLKDTKVIIQVADSLDGVWEDVDSVMTDGHGTATTTRSNDANARFFKLKIRGQE